MPIHATSVVFRERNNTLQTFFEEVENMMEHHGRYVGFNLGQYLAVVGGNLFLQGCECSREELCTPSGGLSL